MAIFKIWEKTRAFRWCEIEAESAEEAERIWAYSPEEIIYTSEWEVEDGQEIDEIEELG